ncbi:hypothetical protein ACWN8V_00770 [Vagococcus elongatus]|uniref:Uncharacterized protein n=1 Tax=Vagococcus elongatus TaxID=180344 RepID=A0A430B5R2_9ENTE|nr:hypothetical protein [Vagococcus elongatus]RSU15637.1 hypothetical protein CBF29_00755 [Vagococcus elongatus]
MDRQTFRDFANRRILQTTLEITGQTYPNMPIQFPPYCCLVFGEDEITIYKIVPLTNTKKSKKIYDVIAYRDIEEIEISPVKKLSFVIIALGTRLNLDLIISLSDGTILHFECEDMVMLPQLSSLLSMLQVPFKDPFDLVEVFEKSTSDRAAYDYLEENLEKIAEQKNIKLLRLTQMED